MDFDSPEPDDFLVDSPGLESREAVPPEDDGSEPDDVELDSRDLDSPETDSRDLDSPELDSPEADSPEADSRDLDSPEADSPEPDAAGADSPPFDWSTAAFFAGAPVERRSFFAQPLPLKTIVGGAKARVTGPSQSGHWLGPNSLRPRKTSNRWRQELQT